MQKRVLCSAGEVQNKQAGEISECAGKNKYFDRLSPRGRVRTQVDWAVWALDSSACAVMHVKVSQKTQREDGTW